MLKKFDATKCLVKMLRNIVIIHVEYISMAWANRLHAVEEIAM